MMTYPFDPPTLNQQMKMKNQTETEKLEWVILPDRASSETQFTEGPFTFNQLAREGNWTAWEKTNGSKAVYACVHLTPAGEQDLYGSVFKSKADALAKITELSAH
jgi:hypothetical protein